MSRKDWKRPPILPPENGKNRIKLIVSYDGSFFFGWQKQNNGITVQGEIEKAIEKVTGEKVNLYGSGRTDSGVHALYQCAHFDTSSEIKAESFAPAINSYLEKGIYILSSEKVDDYFHSRYSTIAREYWYLIKDKDNFLPLDSFKITKIKTLPSFELLNEYAHLLLGKHDYTTFSSVKDSSSSFFRDIYRSEWVMVKDIYKKDVLKYVVTGNAFLYHQVRSMVGTMILLSLKGESPLKFKDILESRDRSKSLTVFPPDGLYLANICYDKNAYCDYEDK